MASVSLPIVIFLVIVMIFGVELKAGHLLNDDSVDFKYANKPIKNRRHTFNMEIIGEGDRKNENTIENDENTPDEDEGEINALTGSKRSESEEDMPDIYLLSETKALKVFRSRGDMLTSCKLVELRWVIYNDVY